MDRSFCQRIIDAGECYADKPAMQIVGVEGTSFTFAEMLRAIRGVAWKIEREGIGLGDRVALIGENHPCWAVAYLGILYRGAVCVPLDPHGEIETLISFFKNSEAKLAFLSPEMADRFGKISERLDHSVRAVYWNAAGNEKITGSECFEDWMAASFPAEFAQADPPSGPSDMALLIYTSGTTGTPKGVPLTHGNIVAELDGINDVLRLSEKESILSLLPLFHAYLQIVNLWVAATYGCEAGYLKELSPAELSNAMKAFRPTILTTVPRLWYLFHKKIFDAVEQKSSIVRLVFKTMLVLNGFTRNAMNINLGPRLFGEVHRGFGSRLRLAVSAGSRFDESVAADFYRLGFTILQGYGLTETSGAATATHEDDNRVGSVGKPMKGTEIRINEPDKDDVGEVLIRGDIVFGGYYKNSDATADAFTNDGWFRSGDLGRIDSDGHLYIVGRAKDVIVLPSGKNVHPEDLEVHYLKTPLVEELAVIGIRDESERHSGAEKLAIVVVPDFEYLKKEKIANSKEAIRYALDNLGRDLPEYQRARDYIIRADALPRTGSRKIKRFELKKEIESGQSNGTAKEAREWNLTDDDRSFLSSRVSKVVAAIIRQNSDGREIHPAMNLEIDLGLDSLARAETFAALEYAFSIEFDTDAAAQALTVRDVVSLIDKQIGSNGHAATLETGLSWGKIVHDAEPDFPEVQGILKDRTALTLFAFVVYKIFKLFCLGFMRLEVTGLDEFRKLKRPFLICPNHQSFLDPFVVCSNYPLEFFRNTFHVGAAMFFENSIMRFIARMLQVVPVDPDTQLMKAMKAGAVGLKHGRILNIYPEGERAYDGELHDFKKGAAILATELGLPIVPVAIDGLHKVWARKTMRIRPAKVKIRFGEAFYAKDVLVPDQSSAASHDSSDPIYAAVTAHLKRSISDMIDEMRK